MTLVLQIAAGIVIALAVWEVCRMAMRNRHTIADKTKGAAQDGYARIHRRRSDIGYYAVVAVALIALGVLGIMRSDAKRAVLNKYYSSQAGDYRQPSPWLDKYGKN